MNKLMKVESLFNTNYKKNVAQLLSYGAGPNLILLSFCIFNCIFFVSDIGNFENIVTFYLYLVFA